VYLELRSVDWRQPAQTGRRKTACGAAIGMRIDDMAASKACPNCNSSVVQHSHWRRSDGVLRRVFFSSFRCHACGHRHHRFNVVGVVGTAVVVLLVTSFFTVANIVSKPYQQPTGSPLASQRVGSR
jgi:predicted RNA-binding Zn-ribbon protein involved in translation (DUF1610 family)